MLGWRRSVMVAPRFLIGLVIDAALHDGIPERRGGGAGRCWAATNAVTRDC